jgi:hypothetical protein
MQMRNVFFIDDVCFSIFDKQLSRFAAVASEFVKIRLNLDKNKLPSIRMYDKWHFARGVCGHTERQSAAAGYASTTGWCEEIMQFVLCTYLSFASW